MQKINFNDKFGLTQAVLEGRKTMTRRIIQEPKKWHGIDVYGFSVNKDNLGNVMDISLVGADGESIEDEKGSLGMIAPKYKIGEIVAVAQSYKDAANGHTFLTNSEYGEHYHVGVFKNAKGWTNKMFVRADLMPHQIRITNISVEKPQDISDEDCIKEGVINGKFRDFPNDMFYPYKNCKDTEVSWTAKYAFAKLIDKVSGKGTWEKNPWVFVYEFELVK